MDQRSKTVSGGISQGNKIVSQSDGSSANYYKIPVSALSIDMQLRMLGFTTEQIEEINTVVFQLQDLISYKNMNAQIGEIFRACFRYGEVAHSKMLRDAKKIEFYSLEEQKRLLKYEAAHDA